MDLNLLNGLYTLTHVECHFIILSINIISADFQWHCLAYHNSKTLLCGHEIRNFRSTVQMYREYYLLYKKNSLDTPRRELFDNCQIININRAIILLLF